MLRDKLHTKGGYRPEKVDSVGFRFLVLGRMHPRMELRQIWVFGGIVWQQGHVSYGRKLGWAGPIGG